MAYDEGLVQRVRETLTEQDGLEEKKMFGGVAFMVMGNMCCGIVNDELMVRVGLEQYKATLRKDHAREMDFTGRPMRGWVFVTPDGLDSDEALGEWVQSGIQFALSLPPK